MRDVSGLPTDILISILADRPEELQEHQIKMVEAVQAELFGRLVVFLRALIRIEKDIKAL